MKSKKYVYFFLSVLIFVIDRVTKFAALQSCTASACVVNPYVSFDVTFNRGIAWGMLNYSTTIGFALVSLLIAIITALLCWDAYRNYIRNKWIIGHVCIIAGSICNIIDRIVYGGVIDFVVLSYKQYSWPVFNVADMAIVCGLFIMIVLDDLF
jgi:signal peptidase II